MTDKKESEKLIAAGRKGGIEIRKRRAMKKALKAFLEKCFKEMQKYDGVDRCKG